MNTKYRGNTNDFKRKIGESHTWRSIREGSEVLEKGTRWRLGNGRRILFWKHSWLEDRPLEEIATIELPENEREKRVIDYWIKDIGWDVATLTKFLPGASLEKLAGMIICEAEENEDRATWSLEASGKFTTKSAYVKELEDTEELVTDRKWRNVWNQQGPGRWQCLSWLIKHGRLMTNQEKCRRHLSQCDKCQFCNGGVETISHMLRECPRVRRIREKLVKPSKWREFWELNFSEWVDWNLRGENLGISETSWQIIFQATVHLLWSSRNNFCATGMEDKLQIRQEEILIRAEMVQSGMSESSRNSRKSIVNIRWEKPEENWIKVNVDGAANMTAGKAGAGGLIRNAYGCWIAGFCASIGKASNVAAEMWAMIHGLRIAWEMGYRSLILETDSRTGLELIRQAPVESPHYNLILTIQNLLSRDWECQIKHTWRDGNVCADHLAKQSLGMQRGLEYLRDPPHTLRELLRQDVIGVAIPRLVNM